MRKLSSAYEKAGRKQQNVKISAVCLDAVKIASRAYTDGKAAEHVEDINYAHIESSDDSGEATVGKNAANCFVGAERNETIKGKDISQIYIRLLDGSTILIDIDLSGTAIDLRKEINKRTGLILDTCRFTCGKGIIADDCSLTESGVTGHSTVHVNLRLVGGMDKIKDKEVRETSRETTRPKREEKARVNKEKRAAREQEKKRAEENRAAKKKTAEEGRAAKEETKLQRQKAAEERRAAMEALETEKIRNRAAKKERKEEDTLRKLKAAADRAAKAAQEKENNAMKKSATKAMKAATKELEQIERKGRKDAKRYESEHGEVNYTSIFEQTGSVSTPSVDDLPSQADTDQCVDDFISRVYGKIPEKRCG